MALFSRLRGAAKQPDLKDDIARNVIAIPLLAAAADGEVSAPEMHDIANMCSFSPIFHAIGIERTQELVAAAFKDMQQLGIQGMVERANQTLAMPQRETAICFAIRVALADGVLEEDEKKMLLALGMHMEIPEEKFFQIFEVISMLQRPVAA